MAAENGQNGEGGGADHTKGGCGLESRGRGLEGGAWTLDHTDGGENKLNIFISL